MKNQGERQNRFGLACLRETELGVEIDIGELKKSTSRAVETERKINRATGHSATVQVRNSTGAKTHAREPTERPWIWVQTDESGPGDSFG
jgi:hypothetical protein